MAGATVDFSLETTLYTAIDPGSLLMMFDRLPLDDPKAAYLKMANTWDQYQDSWAQCALDGSISFRAVDEYWEAGLEFAKLTNDFLFRMGERMDDEPRRWNWVFEEEAGLMKRKKPSSVVVLKMPATWVEKTKKEEEQ